MKEIRADTFTDEQSEENQTISIEELANLVAAKVIQALKIEEKAEETEVKTEEKAEQEEVQEESEQEESVEETEESAEEEEEEQEEESRSIDYSDFEARLAKLKGEA